MSRFTFLYEQWVFDLCGQLIVLKTGFLSQNKPCPNAQKQWKEQNIASLVL